MAPLLLKYIIQKFSLNFRIDIKTFTQVPFYQNPYTYLNSRDFTHDSLLKEDTF